MERNNITKKKKAIIFVGYYYLSTPIYDALKTQLKGFDLHYLYTKDTIASDTNYKYFDNNSLKQTDPCFIEMEYNPPWYGNTFLGKNISIWKKVYIWTIWMFKFPLFRRKVLRFVMDAKPDIILTTSDMFFTPRYIADKMPDIPILLIQPCYLDLWEREYRFKLPKKLINLFQPYIFERQQYFGFEIEREKLLLWEPSAIEIYKQKGKDPLRIINPSHIKIKELSEQVKAKKEEFLEIVFGKVSPKKTISFFTAYYGDVKGHGSNYQQNLEEELVKVVTAVKDDYNVIIKIHPNEQMSYWTNVFTDELTSMENIIILHNCDKFQLMGSSDFMISTNSYAAVEASLMGVVTINFVPGVEIIGKDFCAAFNRNSIISIYETNELIEFLKENIDGEVKRFEQRISNVQDDIFGYSEPEKPRRVEDIMNELTRQTTNTF
jgi:hypothetical protein